MGRYSNILIIYSSIYITICYDNIMAADQVSNVTTTITYAGAANDFSFRPEHEQKSHTTNSTHSDSIIIRLEQYLEASSIVYGLAKIASSYSVSQDCLQQFEMFQSGVLTREPWAMKVLDSSGSKEPGFIWGQNFWLGSRLGCESVQKPLRVKLSNRFQRSMKEGLVNDVSTPFEVDYRVVYLRHNSPWQVEIKLMTERIIHIGLCLPKACSSLEIRNLTQQYANGPLFLEGAVYDLHPEVIYIKDLKVREAFNAKKSVIIIGAFLLFTLLMIICAGVLNLITAPDHDDQVSSKNADDSVGSSSKLPDWSNKVQQFIKCFDLSSNLRKMFTLYEMTPNTIPVINGLRSVSCICIEFLHCVWFFYFTVDNKAHLMSYAEGGFFKISMCVDVFFTISGFLQVLKFLNDNTNLEIARNNSLAQNTKLFLKMVFQRYLRLAPLYLLVTGVVEIFSSYFEDVSIFHIHERYEEYCSKSWWKNIILIQNWFDSNEMCLTWTWSLACEMQFFLLALILLLAYAKYPNQVKVIVCCALLGSIGCTYKSGLSTQFQLSFDVAYSAFTEFYINPLVRVLPYLLGAATGWLVAERKGQFQISPLVEKLMWNLALMFFIVYLIVPIQITSCLLSVTLVLLWRLIYAIIACWLIVCSVTGRRTWYSRILENKVFLHINRLTYAIYLLNPLVVLSLFSLAKTSTHADPLFLGVVGSGIIVVTYLMSIVFSLAFEIPYCNWSSQLFKEKRKSA